MAADPLTYAWRPYRDAVDAYYKIVQSAVGDDRELGPDREVPEAERALQNVVERSQAMTEIGEAQLRLARDAEHDRVAARLLAAGAVDIAVACETLRVCPDRPVEDPTVITEERQTPGETALDLLAEANRLFGGGDDEEPDNGGGAPKRPTLPVAPKQGDGAQGLKSGDLATESSGPAQLAGGCLGPGQLTLSEATDDSLNALIHEAVEPGFKFASGAVSGITAGFHITAAAEPLERLGVLAQHVGVIKRRLVRLLASGFQKLVGASSVASQRLVGQGLGVIESRAFGLAGHRLRDPFRDLLGWLVRYESAKADAESAIAQQDTLGPEEADGIAEELEKLTRAYREEMIWTGRVAKWLTWAAPFISTLAVHAGGPLLVVGLNALGTGFVLYTLDVRIDGHGLPARVRSIVQIVNDELAHLP
jgi:hypothetical protein